MGGANRLQNGQAIGGPGYQGSTYSVKYLGIVDGAMGVLSRKMAMQNVKNENSIILSSQNSMKKSLSKDNRGFSQA